MQIGNYKGTISLLWDNAKDRNHDEAIQQLKRKTNGIKRIVIKLDGDAKYSTQQLIKWFMGQRWSNGFQHTHRLVPARTYTNKTGKTIHKPEHITQVSRRKPYKYQVWIPSLQIIQHGVSTFYRPGVHIENTDTGVSEAKAEYKALISDWKYTPEPLVPIKVEAENPINEYLLVHLINAYEVDEYSEGLIEYYIAHKIPISRAPQDDVIYGEFIKLGIAPAYSALNLEAQPLYIEEEIEYTNFF